MIEISHLFKCFGEKKVLSDFSASFEEGTIACIMGPSGCGKSTLFRILMGLELPDSGTVSGVPERIGAVFQENCLCAHLSAFDNILLTSPNVNKDIIRKTLSDLGLKNDMNTKASELSGGMKRRVAIARALLFDAPILLFDEAFSGLDEALRLCVIEAIQKQRHGRTLLLITHEVQDSQMLSAVKVLQMPSVSQMTP